MTEGDTQMKLSFKKVHENIEKTWAILLSKSYER